LLAVPKARKANKVCKRKSIYLQERIKLFQQAKFSPVLADGVCKSLDLDLTGTGGKGNFLNPSKHKYTKNSTQLAVTTHAGKCCAQNSHATKTNPFIARVYN
jgi:hypothetical protein